MEIEMEAGEETGNFSPAPDGPYLLKVVEVEDGKTQKGIPKTSLTIEIAEGPFEGKKLYHTLAWIKKGEPGHGFALRALHAMGMPYQGTLAFDTQDIKGQTFRAVLTTEDYESKDGQPRQKNVIYEFLVGDEQGSRPPQKKAPKKSAAPAEAAEDLEEVPF